jgi:hypothetical protein
MLLHPPIVMPATLSPAGASDPSRAALLKCVLGAKRRTTSWAVLKGPLR